MAKKQAAPKIDAEWAALASDILRETCDLTEDAPITVEPYSDPDMVSVSGVLWDGRPIEETYRRIAGEIFCIKALGSRYRIVAGEYWNGGRMRRYAAFLVN